MERKGWAFPMLSVRIWVILGWGKHCWHQMTFTLGLVMVSYIWAYPYTLALVRITKLLAYLSGRKDWQRVLYFGAFSKLLQFLQLQFFQGVKATLLPHLLTAFYGGF